MKSLSALCHMLYDLKQFCGLMQISDSISTISWSLMPGSGLQCKIKDGMLVINKSRMFVRRDGSSPSGLGHGLLGSLSQSSVR